MTNVKLAVPPAIKWQDSKLYLLDQTQLPHETVYEHQDTPQRLLDAIRALKVRGAPAIGVAAAYGLCMCARPAVDWPVDEFRSEVEKQAAFLKTARPTAVNLAWALDRMCKTVRQSTAKSGRELLDLMIDEAQAIHNEDIELCNAMGKNGAHLIRPGMGVLTHCNAGSLATSGIGTATAPMYVAHASGTDFTVYADETRPLLQGARLTAWELQKAGIDVRLICDNMAGHLMARGDIDMVITGTDRVAANGDVANKIGTMSAAILAHHFGIPFYVACPSSTIDFNCPDGTNIPIEERAGHEVTSFANCQAAAPGTRTANPAFDVTPAEFVTGLITEKGIITAPYRAGLKALHG